MTRQTTRRAFLQSVPIAAVSVGIAQPSEAASPPTIEDRIATLKAVLEAKTGTTWAVVDGLENAGALSLIDLATKLKDILGAIPPTCGFVTSGGFKR